MNSPETIRNCGKMDRCGHVACRDEIIKDLQRLSNFPTSDIIDELDKRRPCEKCVYGPNAIQCDELCTWGMKLEDKFKPATGTGNETDKGLEAQGDK